MVRKVVSIGIVVLIAALAFAGPAPAAEPRAERAEAFIRGLAHDAIAKLTDASMPRAQRVINLESMMDEHFAAETVAKWVLGRFWNRADAAQQARYLSVYRRYMIESYVDRFTRYSGETLEVLFTEVYDDKDLIVKTEMKRPGIPEPLKIDWRVRDSDGTVKVLDIMVEGVSMAQAQRAEFASALRDLNGDMDAFLDELNARIEEAARAAQSAAAGG